LGGLAVTPFQVSESLVSYATLFPDTSGVVLHLADSRINEKLEERPGRRRASRPEEVDEVVKV
jgi:hypothetical protein